MYRFLLFIALTACPLANAEEERGDFSSHSTAARVLCSLATEGPLETVAIRASVNSQALRAITYDLWVSEGLAGFYRGWWCNALRAGRWYPRFEVMEHTATHHPLSKGFALGVTDTLISPLDRLRTAYVLGAGTFRLSGMNWSPSNAYAGYRAHMIVSTAHWGSFLFTEQKTRAVLRSLVSNHHKGTVQEDALVSVMTGIVSTGVNATTSPLRVAAVTQQSLFPHHDTSLLRTLEGIFLKQGSTPFRRVGMLSLVSSTWGSFLTIVLGLS